MEILESVRLQNPPGDSMAIAYKDQSIHALRYYFAAELVDSSSFRILNSAEISLGPITAYFHILGESHLITFQSNGNSFSELVSCSLENLEIADSKKTSPNPLLLSDRENFSYRSEDHSFDYHFQSEKCSIENQSDSLNALLSQTPSGTCRIEQEFPDSAVTPSESKNRNYPAKTIVDCCCRRIENSQSQPAEDGIHFDINTWHIYPQEQKFLKTRTLLNWHSFQTKL